MCYLRQVYLRNFSPSFRVKVLPIGLQIPCPQDLRTTSWVVIAKFSTPRIARVFRVSPRFQLLGNSKGKSTTCPDRTRTPETESTTEGSHNASSGEAHRPQESRILRDGGCINLGNFSRSPTCTDRQDSQLFLGNCATSASLPNLTWAKFGLVSAWCCQGDVTRGLGDSLSVQRSRHRCRLNALPRCVGRSTLVQEGQRRRTAG
jgi:hypothetical protein